MKKIFLAAALALGLIQATTLDTQAQVSVNINIGNQPAWGPVGYDYVQFYYIPEINAYYDVMTGQYIFLQNRRWIHARVLPPRYRHFDLYRTHKVVINNHNPYMYNNQHRRDYGRYRNDRSQIALRDHRGPQRPAIHQNNGPRRPQNGYHTPQNRPTVQQNNRNNRTNQGMQRPAPQHRPMVQHNNRNDRGNLNMQRTTPQNRPMAQQNSRNDRGNLNIQRSTPQRDRIQQSSRNNKQQQQNQHRNEGPRR